jgi:hypothetical protein
LNSGFDHVALYPQSRMKNDLIHNPTFKIQNLPSLVTPEPRSAEEDHHPKNPVILLKNAF